MSVQFEVPTRGESLFITITPEDIAQAKTGDIEQRVLNYTFKRMYPEGLGQIGWTAGPKHRRVTLCFDGGPRLGYALSPETTEEVDQFRLTGVWSVSQRHIELTPDPSLDADEWQLGDPNSEGVEIVMILQDPELRKRLGLPLDGYAIMHQSQM